MRFLCKFGLHVPKNLVVRQEEDTADAVCFGCSKQLEVRVSPEIAKVLREEQVESDNNG